MTPTDIFAATLQLSSPWFISSVELKELPNNPLMKELNIYIDF